LFEKLTKAINREGTRSVQVSLVFVHITVPHFTEQSTNNVTLNFSNNTAAAAAEVSMDIETAFDTIRQSGLLYVLSRLILSVSVIKL
jgi:hypothetical protein